MAVPVGWKGKLFAVLVVSSQLLQYCFTLESAAVSKGY